MSAPGFRETHKGIWTRTAQNEKQKSESAPDKEQGCDECVLNQELQAE
jgi:hypothetical protein